MTVSLQIRDVPEPVRDVIAEAARKRGMSVQAYLLDLIEHQARVLRNAEMFERMAPYRVVIPPELDPTVLIRQWRDEE